MPNTEVVYQPEEVNQLASALGACLLVQRTYGKQGADIDKITKIFLRVLSDYEPKAVIQAIKRWLQESPEFPTPSDIVKMLNPTQKFDKELYIKYSRQFNAGDLADWSSGYAYMKAYEAQKLKEFDSGKKAT